MPKQAEYDKIKLFEVNSATMANGLRTKGSVLVVKIDKPPSAKPITGQAFFAALHKELDAQGLNRSNVVSPPLRKAIVMRLTK